MLDYDAGTIRQPAGSAGAAAAAPHRSMLPDVLHRVRETKCKDCYEEGTLQRAGRASGRTTAAAAVCDCSDTVMAARAFTNPSCGMQNKMDAVRGKILSRFGKRIIQLVKVGGPDPTSNSKLADMIRQAKDAGKHRGHGLRCQAHMCGRQPGPHHRQASPQL